MVVGFRHLLQFLTTLIFVDYAYGKNVVSGKAWDGQSIVCVCLVIKIQKKVNKWGNLYQICHLKIYGDRVRGKLNHLGLVMVNRIISKCGFF